MPIYPRKKVLKASTGLNTQVVDTLGSVASGAGMLAPALSIGKVLGQAISGDGSDAAANVVGGILNPMSSLDALAQGRFKEAIPVFGGIAKANRIKKEQEEELRRKTAMDSSRLTAEGKQAYGQLTFDKGGSAPDLEPDGSIPVQEKAVVLGGKSHENGGNDIIDASTGEKLAETEANELLFTKDQTSQIESHIAKYEKTRDQYCLWELGEFVAGVIKNQLKDYSGKYK